MASPMPERDPMLTGLSCALALGCFASISIQSIAFVLAIIVLMVRVDRNGWKIQRLPGIDVPILGYICAFLISAVMGVDSQASFAYITELKRPLIAYVVASSITTRRDAWFLARVVLAGAVISVSFEMYQYIFGGTYKIHAITRFYQPYELLQPMGLSATHNDLAMLLAQALGFVLIPVAFYFSHLTVPQRTGAVVVSLILFAGILRTLSRASLIGALAGVIAVGLALRPRRLLTVLLVLGLIYPCLPKDLKQRHTNVFDLKSNYSNWFRYRMMEISATIAKDHMPWGIGRHNFPKVQSELKEPQEEVSPHAHNNYLQILCEMGIPGIVAFVWIQVAVVLYLGRRVRCLRYEVPERALLGAILMGYVSFVVNGFFHYSWGDALPSCFMWVSVGLACAVGEKMATSPAPLTACDALPPAASKELA